MQVGEVVEGGGGEVDIIILLFKNEVFLVFAMGCEMELEFEVVTDCTNEGSIAIENADIDHWRRDNKNVQPRSIPKMIDSNTQGRQHNPYIIQR